MKNLSITVFILFCIKTFSQTSIYDQNNRLTEVRHPNYIITYSYDNFGSLSSKNITLIKEEVTIPEDLDNNNVVNQADIDLMIQYIFSNSVSNTSDLNKDNEVNIFDLMFIIRYIREENNKHN